MVSSSYGRQRYSGPRWFEIAWQTSLTAADAVLSAIPKVLAVIPRDPVSFKKYNATATFFSALNALWLGDFGFGEM